MGRARGAQPGVGYSSAANLVAFRLSSCAAGPVRLYLWNWTKSGSAGRILSSPQDFARRKRGPSALRRAS